MLLPQKGYFCYADIEGLQVYCYDTNGFSKNVLFTYFAENILDFIHDIIRNIAMDGNLEQQGAYTAMFEIMPKIKKFSFTRKQIMDYISLFTNGLEVSIFMPYLVNVGTYKFFQVTSFQYPVIQDKKEFLILTFTPDKDMIKNMLTLIEEDVKTIMSFVEQKNGSR